MTKYIANFFVAPGIAMRIEFWLDQYGTEIALNEYCEKLASKLGAKFMYCEEEEEGDEE